MSSGKGHDRWREGPDVYLPTDIKRLIHRYPEQHDLGRDDPLVDLTSRSVQRTTETAAEETGNEDFTLVRSHDLRWYFAHTCLVEERMNPRVVMDIGGWDDYKSFEPYLSKPSPSTIVDEFERAGLE